jgi:iron complex transport system substrate-binding protein
MIRKSLPFMIAIILFTAIAAEGQERLLTDEIGRRVKIPESPRRIVSLAPSITEILFALGLNKEIVGVTIYCDYPEVALEKPKIGGFVNPSMEKIVSLKPDLIIGTRDGNRWETIHRLNGLGFPVYLIDPKGFDGVIKMIKNIGEMVGRQKESEKIVVGMMVGKEEIATRAQFLPKPKVFFQVGYTPIITVGKGSLVDDLIRFAGGRNISENERANYPLYNIEAILEKAPEIIIMSSMDGKGNHSDLIKMWQNWKNIPAVQMKAIYVIDSNLVDRPSPRIIKGLEIMVRMIHPNIWGEKQ